MQRKPSTLRLMAILIALGTVCIAVPFLSNQLRAKATLSSSTAERGQRRSSVDPEFFAFAESLPSYQALQQSLDDLATSTADLLRAAAKNDAALVSQSAQDYRQSLRQIDNNFELLAGRIGRDRATDAYDELCQNLDFDWKPTTLALPSKPQE